MSLETITLTRIRTGISNLTQTLAEWGITQPVLKLCGQASTSAGDDEFRFTIPMDPADTRPFQQFDRIELRNADDDRIAAAAHSAGVRVQSR